MKSCRVAETSEELMRRISIFGAAAILVAAVASPSITQAACAQYDPGCATYPMPKKEDAAKSTSVRAGVGAEVGAQQPADRSTVRTGVRAEVAAQQPADRPTVRTGVRAEVGAQQPADRSTVRTGRLEQRTAVREARYTTDAGGPVRAAGAVATGAVATAGAIATAPLRTADSYAYYDEGYGGWDRRSYAERNGFVCTPGELFKGFDGRLHVCQ
jgi:hypothetical protein